MLKTIIKIIRTPINTFKIPYRSITAKNDNDTELLTYQKYEIVNTKKLPNDDSINLKNDGNGALSVLDENKEDITHIAPYLKPSFNFAAYVNKSETLQKLVHLGVNLYELEKNAEIPPYLLRLDFENDIKQYIIFLQDLGLHIDDVGSFINKNPFIFKEDLENLKIRINYLKSKKFDDAMILRIVQANPLWLSFSTQDIDKKLGFFQKTFSLTGREVRNLTTKKPHLITANLKHVKLNHFVIKEEMGFTPEEVKQILLKCPRLFTKNQKFILNTFEYIHKKMGISLETIVEMPQILTCREFRIRQRHLFLEKLGKIQFDRTKPNYISPLTIVSGTDAHFSTEVAGSSVLAFNTFLKSL